MRKYKKFFCFFLSTLMCLTGCSISKHLLQNDIKSYLDDNYNSNQEITINLSDFTNFDWDTLLIFQYPVSAQDIENAIGVKYEGSLDLTSGMIFVLDGQIVHDEIFKDDYTNLAPFLIYPYDSINADLNYNVFTFETALFKCEKVNSKELYGYRLYPIQNMGGSLIN